MTHRYDDIINLPHHVSQKHAPMARADRAAQFSPFAALTGLDAALRETARLTDQRITLDEYEQAALDETLQTVRDTLTKKEHPTVEVCYFVPDTRKAGGAYCTVTGRGTNGGDRGFGTTRITERKGQKQHSYFKSIKKTRSTC